MEEANDAAFMTARSPSIAHSVSKGSFADLAYVLFSSWLYPARTAHRIANWSLPACWLLHICTGLVGVVLAALLFSAIAESPTAAVREVNVALDKWVQHPWIISPLLMGVIVYGEVIAVGIAFAVSAWGAVADERLRDSFRHSLRQTWVRTVHAALIAVGVCVFAGILEKAGREWRLTNPTPPSMAWPLFPTPPTVPSNDLNYAAAQKQYQKDMQEFQVKSAAAARAGREWRATQPWYVQHQEPITMGAGFVGVLWWVVALLAAVGIRRLVEVTERSPLCLRCGYDLSHMPIEGRCPECGGPVVESLGPQAQPGAAWEKRADLGTWRAWWRTWRSWGRDVASFGRDLKIHSQSPEYRKFFFLHLPVIFVIGAVGMAVPVGLLPGQASPFENRVMAAFAGGLFGTLCMIGTTLVVCASASLLGWYASLRAQRNLLPASIQISAYGVVYLVAWEIFGAIIINGAMHLYLSGILDIAQEFTGIHRDGLFFLSCFVLNAVCGLVYLWMVARGTNAARFANK